MKKTFSNSKYILKRKLDFQDCAGYRKFLQKIFKIVHEHAIPAHVITIKFMGLFSKTIFRILQFYYFYLKINYSFHKKQFKKDLNFIKLRFVKK